MGRPSAILAETLQLGSGDILKAHGDWDQDVVLTQCRIDDIAFLTPSASAETVGPSDQGRDSPLQASGGRDSVPEGEVLIRGCSFSFPFQTFFFCICWTLVCSHIAMRRPDSKFWFLEHEAGPGSVDLIMVTDPPHGQELSGRLADDTGNTANMSAFLGQKAVAQGQSRDCVMFAARLLFPSPRFLVDGFGTCAVSTRLLDSSPANGSICFCSTETGSTDGND